MIPKRIFLTLLVIGTQSAKSYQECPNLSVSEDFEHLEYRLQQEPLIDRVPFKGGQGIRPTHKIELITLESGLKALFKTGEYHYAEVAGYRLSKLLNVFLVPPTIFRTIEGVQGSLQLYISAPNLASVLDPLKLLEKVGKKAICDAKFFYYLAGQWDTHYGNQLIAKHGGRFRLWLIDNSGILHRSYSTFGGSTFIEKGVNQAIPSHTTKEFPFDQALTIAGNRAYTLFSPYITSERHLLSLSNHATHTYVIWKSTLWLAYDTAAPSHFGRCTNCYFSSTLKASMTLTHENLASVWAELMLVDPSATKELIELTLQRRDELIKDSLANAILKD